MIKVNVINTKAEPVRIREPNAARVGIDEKVIDVSKEYDDTELREMISGKSDVGHTHPEYITEDHDTVYDDTELREMIGGKADANHTHSQYLTEHQDISGKSDVGHTHPEYITEDHDTVYDDTEVRTLIAGKAEKNHTHDQYVISSSLAQMFEDFDNYIGENLNIRFAEASNQIGTALSGKSDSDHTHSEYVSLAYVDANYQPQDVYIDYGSNAYTFEQIYYGATNGVTVNVVDDVNFQFTIMSRVEIIDGMPYLVWANDSFRYRLSAAGDWSSEEIPQYTDEHINALIAAQIGVIEDGTY